MRPGTVKKKKFKVSQKFVNDDFVSFLSCLLPLDEDNATIKRRLIKGEGSLEELADDYQLPILHGIVLDDIMKLFEEAGFVRIHNKENCIQYSTKDITLLISAIKQELGD